MAHSFEIGLRGTLHAPWDGKTQWQAGFFTTTNANDILFQATGGAQSNEGYFANVGDTRRQGFGASLIGKTFDNRLDCMSTTLISMPRSARRSWKTARTIRTPIPTPA